MNGRRPLRSNSDLVGTPLHHLELPPRPRGVGRAASPNSPRNPGDLAAFFAARIEASPTHPASTSELEDNFEDAASDNSNSSIMAFQPPAEGAPIEEIRRYADAMREQAIQFSQSLATTTSLLQQSLTNQSNATVHKRRPELPPWDPKNLEAWIRRVENAFIRAGITEAKEKFAHLESVISVDLHPTVNEFFNGTATQDNYNSLLAFLRSRYGRTKEQKVRAALDGVRRNNRLPTDLMALLKDQVDDVTIEDILKVHLFSELPQSVRENLTDKLDTHSSDELAKAADAYFNRDGSLRATNSRNINAVTAPVPSAELEETSGLQPLFTPAFDDLPQSNSSVNAVYSNRNNNRQPNPNNNNRGGSGNNRNSRQRSQSSNRRGGRNGNNRSQSRSSQATANPNHCSFHQQWGSEARNCRAPCSFNSGSNNPNQNNSRQNNSNQGNYRGGRR